MSRNISPSARVSPQAYSPNSSIAEYPSLQVVQEKIYDFLIQMVKVWEPVKILQEFQKIFFDALANNVSSNVPNIYLALSATDEEEYYRTLKRCCYILINNWEGRRKHQAYIIDLIELFNNIYYSSRFQDELRKGNIFYKWLYVFIHSHDYEELLIFAQRHDWRNKDSWVERYTSYLLIEQSVNQNNPREQQEAARKLARSLRDKFKFELAMYIARSQSNYSHLNHYHNPTFLGDNVLRLIKSIVIRKGVFSYENIANIFLQQTKNKTLKEFKLSLEKYLIFSVQQQNHVEILRQQISEKLASWKPEYDNRIIDRDLLLRVCNRTIDFLTTENAREPSQLLIMLLSQGHPLTLVVVLLKIVLACRHSRSHVELRIANLINYYNQFPEQECQWIINFIEIFNITFAIYADNVEYNLIKMDKQVPTSLPKTSHQPGQLDRYRVFSQLRQDLESHSI